MQRHRYLEHVKTRIIVKA